jgi:hypothetical protein
MKNVNSVSNITLDELYQTKLNLFATESRLEIYNDIIHELDAHNFLNEINEIKYRIGGGEDIHQVFLSVLSQIKESPLPLRSYWVCIDAFIDEDIYKLFK